MNFRRRLTSLLALGLLPVCASVALAADEAPPPSSSAVSAQGEIPPPEPISEALTLAASNGRDVLVVFDASELGGWCERMRREVLSHPSFGPGVARGFVPVILDHTRKATAEAEARRRTLAYERRLGVTGFPSVLLLDSTGRAYARTGYRGNGPAAFLRHLYELRSLREKRDALIAKSRRNSGYIRAEHLANALRTIDGSLASEYAPLFEELRAVDKTDRHGVLLDYDIIRLTRRARDAARAARSQAAALREFDEFLAARRTLPPAKRQRVLVERFAYLDRSGADGLSRLERSQSRLAELRAMLALAPESPEAPRIRKLFEDEAREMQRVHREAVEGEHAASP